MNTELLQTAAALPAAAPEIGATANSQITNAAGEAASSPIPKDFEFDLADPRECEYRKRGNIDLFARLEEIDPYDLPGQLSDFVLRIIEGGSCINLQAESGRVPQPYGGYSTHLLGHLSPASIRRFVEEAETGAAIAIGLREYDEETRPFNGAVLSFSGGDRPELRLCLGGHCFGALRGELVRKFLSCARIRLDMELE
jgi:hypothetical protein